MAKKEILKPFIRSWEGGYCNVPGDRGGATKWGVTITTYRSVYGQQCTTTDLRNMTEDQWDQIYHKLYWPTRYSRSPLPTSSSIGCGTPGSTASSCRRKSSESTSTAS